MFKRIVKAPFLNYIIKVRLDINKTEKKNIYSDIM